MKIIILDKKSFGIDSIASAFKKLGHSVVISKILLDDDRVSKTFEKFFKENINSNYDAVFTFNYFPVISNECKKYNVKYISWVYDSPHVSLFSCSIINPCNFVFIFDKEMYLELANAGITTVYYLPLAADIKNPSKRNEYLCDASFVGSLYTEEKHQLMERHFKNITDYTKGYLDGIIKAQLKVYGCFMLQDLLSTDIVNDLQKSIEIKPNSDGVETPEYVYANYFLARKVTSLERLEIIEMLSDVCKFSLHTHTNNPVDYYNDMPSVFASSKINLNISLKSIKSGIPLRCFDIMGCGGFLLSNFQADFLDYFIPGEDFVYYENTFDAVQKVKYYLAHENERLQIQANAQGKINEGHTFLHRAEIISEIVFE